MMRAALSIALLLLAPLAVARGDYAIGVTGNHITVAGNVIQGADTEFDPTDIADCQLWLDASDASTLTMSNVYVTAWADKSGGGHDATQATLNLRPQLAEWTNGVNAISMDGLDALVTTAFFNTSNHTFVVVAKRNGARVDDDMIMAGQLSTGGALLMGYQSRQRAHYFSASSGLLVRDYVLPSVTQKYIFGQMVTDSNLVALVNGVNVGTTVNATPRPANSVVIRVGSRVDFPAQGLVGLIAEVVIYDRALNTAEILEVTNYLKTKWSIQ